MPQDALKTVLEDREKLLASAVGIQVRWPPHEAVPKPRSPSRT